MKWRNLLAGILGGILTYSPIASAKMDKKDEQMFQNTRSISRILDARPQSRTPYLENHPTIKSLTNSQTSIPQTSTSMQFNMQGTLRNDITLNDILDSEILLDVFLPNFAREGHQNKLIELLDKDLNRINNNINNFLDSPEADHLRQSVGDIPFNDLINALRNQDRDLANLIGDQISGQLRDIQTFVTNENLDDKFRDTIKFESLTIDYIKKLIPTIFDDLNITNDDENYKSNFENHGDLDAKLSLYTKTEFPGEHNITLEQAKVLTAKGYGKGNLDLNINKDKPDYQDVINTIQNQDPELLGDYGVKFKASYNTDFTIEDICANQASIELNKRLKAGIGINKNHFESKKTESRYDLSLSLQDIHLDLVNNKTKSEGDITLAHLFVDQTGKNFYFLDVGHENKTYTTKTKIESSEKSETETKSHKYKVLTNLFAGTTLETKVGNFTPFVTVRDNKTGYGLFLNTKFVTGYTDTNNNKEIFVRVNGRDQELVLDYLKQLKKLDHSHFPATDNQKEELLNQMKQKLGHVLLKYSEQKTDVQDYGEEGNVEGKLKSYSVSFGNHKSNMEIGKKIDDLVETNFAILNVKGFRISAENGKNYCGNYNSKRLKTVIPLNFGDLQFDLYQDPNDSDDSPSHDFTIKKTIRF